MAVYGVKETKPYEPAAPGSKRRAASEQEQLGLWWEKPKEDPVAVANAIMHSARSIERWSWKRRYDNMIYSRFLTGRDVVSSYNFSTVQRPSALSRSYGSSTWTPPAFNAIATCADVYSTRIWCMRPFVQVIPLAAGGFKARTRCKKLSKFFDAVAEETEFWRKLEEVGIDCMATSVGAVKVHEDQSHKGHIAITRVHSDELLISEEEALYGDPHSMMQRVFCHRSYLLATYGKDPETRAAIMRAASVHPAFYSGGDINFKQVVPLIEAWSKPLPDGTPGRHVLVIPGHVLLDEPYLRRFFPFAIIRFKHLSGSWFGQGLVEQALPLQRALNRTMAAIDESQERVAWPRVDIENGSSVAVEQLAGIPGGAVNYTGKAPVWHVPQAMSEEVYSYRRELVGAIMQRLGISEQAATGEKARGVNSGAGLMAAVQIEDTRHRDLAQRVEDFVTTTAKLVFAVAEDVKPKVTDPGRRGAVIDWVDARLTFNPQDMTSSEFNARAFPMSRLPSTISGREQQVNDWLANGQISKQDAMRLGVQPDTEGEAQLQSAPRDNIDRILDDIVEDGKWRPPSVFMDLSLGLAVAQSRHQMEESLGTPEDRLRLLLQWISAVHDLIEDAAPPPSFGIAPPPSVGAAAPPLPPSQIAPPAAAPAPAQT